MRHKHFINKAGTFNATLFTLFLLICFGQYSSSLKKKSSLLG